MNISLNVLAQTYYVLCAIFVALFLTSFLILRKNRTRKNVEGQSMRKPTHFLDMDTVDAKCDICFGKVEEDTVKECSCGKVFHNDCIDGTGECPYCKAASNNMTERDSRKGECYACHEQLDGNICPSCNTVTPWKDGTFRCICGHEMHFSNDKCSKCGATYRYDE